MGYSAPEGEQFLTIPDAKLCVGECNALQEAMQSFAWADAKLCVGGCKALREKRHIFIDIWAKQIGNKL